MDGVTFSAALRDKLAGLSISMTAAAITMFPLSVCSAVCLPDRDTCLQSEAAHLLWQADTQSGRRPTASVTDWFGRAASTSVVSSRSTTEPAECYPSKNRPDKHTAGSSFTLSPRHMISPASGLPRVHAQIHFMRGSGWVSTCHH